ncbi:MAG TPA: hypothetical protein DCM50_08330, partial [Stenotrophomonas sp.]|nr:hypothetical protein [Stenotrophomonas sp.]
QSAGIEQVNQTITQMDETTQQNAALVEEATAAARSMEEQAGHLTDAVALFKLDGQSAPVVTASAGTVRAPAASPRGRPAPAPARRAAVREPALANEGDWQEF